ncbi:non-homologous end-joining DNA ligase [Isoptericola sp. b441]|uniref:DNA ligase (ATP) n=1 Tax=Actinotalea lenta TaxID=3064654 RepID=A0ABT9DAB9_9CELL|nr:non-homologous end-joining DNA ligase [Isoptericola sp. b441]MDO8107854.1 non-homologous end-joining DNA ligase [Isoptericola sp. b441]
MSGPQFVQPQLATLVQDPVEGDEWVFERKLDGVRLQAVRDGGDVRLYTRSGHDRSSTYPEVVDALAAQRSDRFVLDGEVVAFEGSVTSFSRLQQRSGLRDPDEARASGVAVTFYVFDILHLDGEDCRGRPLRERKQLARDALRFDDPLRLCAHRNGAGPQLLADACRRGWEGLIAKRADRPYRSGRSRDWLKLKCVAEQELVIGGFTEPQGSRTGIGALLLGYQGQDGLRYAGRVGTGFDEATLTELSDELGGRERPTSPFTDAPDGPGTHWVRPDLVCQVAFTEWTSGGRLRHPRYLGLREDKRAQDVVREVPEGHP